jgi:hypothetical protein
MDYLRTIKLGLGKGIPRIQACWMTALQAHLGGEWTDQCDCVDPVINNLCIIINDIYGSDDTGRTEDILEFGLFAPLGTKGTIEDSQRRMFKLVDVAVRVWTPYRLRLRHNEELAIKLEQLSPIVDKETAKTADIVAANVATYAYSAAADIAADATYVLAVATYAYSAAYSAAAAAAAAAVAEYAVKSSEYINVKRQFLKEYVYSSEYINVKRQFLKEYVYPVLRELIEMGPKASKEPDLPVCGVQKFQELVGIST